MLGIVSGYVIAVSQVPVILEGTTQITEMIYELL